MSIKLTNEAVLFASLLGGAAIRQAQRLNQVDSRFADRVLPVVPFLPIKNKTVVTQGEPFNLDGDFHWKADAPKPAEQQFWPLTFEDEKGNRYTLPYEPLINLSSKNNIVKRTVAKMGDEQIIQGTVKERWSRDDWSIKVTGVLQGENMRAFPKDDFQKLRDLLITTKRWTIYCEPLYLLGINYVVVESMDFPFSKGENVQAYEMELTSDYPFNLLIQEEDVL